MSGYPELNFPRFHTEAARLRSLGHEVVSPAEVNVPHPGGWNLAMRADIAVLVTCEAVATLPDWQKSKGATLEVHIAKALGMSVIPAEKLAATPMERTV